MTSGVDILKVNLKSLSFGVRNANNYYAMQYVHSSIMHYCITKNTNCTNFMFNYYKLRVTWFGLIIKIQQ